MVAIILWESAVINLTLIMVIIFLLICEAVTGTYSVRESTDLLHLYECLWMYPFRDFSTKWIEQGQNKFFEDIATEEKYLTDCWVQLLTKHKFITEA